MQGVIKKQNEKVDVLERLIKEYNLVYYEHLLSRNSYFNVDAVYDEKQNDVYTQITGGYYLNNSNWLTAELNRVILRNFMILRSLFGDYEISLVVSRDHQEFVRINEDVLKLLNSYGGKVVFSDNLDQNFYHKEDGGSEIYSLNWNLSKGKKEYKNVGKIHLACYESHIEEIRFDTKIDELANIKTECFGKIFDDEPNVLRKRLKENLLILISSRLDNRNSILLATQIVACISIIENISEQELLGIIKDLMDKLNVYDNRLLNEILHLVLEYQCYMFIWNQDDIKEGSLMQKAQSNIDVYKKERHKKTDL